MSTFFDIDTNKKVSSKTSSNWLTDDAQSKIINKAVNESVIPQNDLTGGSNWIFTGLKNSSVFNLKGDSKKEINHILPYRLQSLMLRNRDFGNFCETVMMCMKLNVRWSIFEVIVPDHIQELVGGSRISLFSELDSVDVIWRVFK